jgi:hypothetical protein
MRVAELVEEIELDARVARPEQGIPASGVAEVLRQGPYTLPSKTVTDAAFPCGEQGYPGRAPGSVQPLPGRLPR